MGNLPSPCLSLFSSPGTLDTIASCSRFCPILCPFQSTINWTKSPKWPTDEEFARERRWWGRRSWARSRRSREAPPGPMWPTWRDLCAEVIGAHKTHLSLWMIRGQGTQSGRGRGGANVAGGAKRRDGRADRRFPDPPLFAHPARHLTDDRMSNRWMMSGSRIPRLWWSQSHILCTISLFTSWYNTIFGQIKNTTKRVWSLSSMILGIQGLLTGI